MNNDRQSTLTDLLDEAETLMLDMDGTLLDLAYDNYIALEHQVSNAELVIRLSSWIIITIVFIVFENVLDPLFSSWLPLYIISKVALLAWMIHPHTLGAYLLFITKFHPWLTLQVRHLPHSLRSFWPVEP